MATFDIVILSSSPSTSAAGAAKPDGTRPSPQQRVRMSAYAPLSPERLQPSPRRPPRASKSGSRAAPVPCGAPTGFATAASLLESKQLVLDPEDHIEGIQNAQFRELFEDNVGKPDEKLRKPRKPSTNTQGAGPHGNSKLKKPRASKVKTDSGGYNTGDCAGAFHEPASSRVPALVASIETVSELGAQTKPAPKKRRSKAAKANNEENPPLDALSELTTTMSSYMDDAGSARRLGVTVRHEPANSSKGKLAGPKKTQSKKTKSTVRETTILAETTNSNATKRRSGSATMKKKKSTGSVSSHFAVQTQKRRDDPDHTIWDVPPSPSRRNSICKGDSTTADAQELLDEVVSRRRDWTPVRDTAAELSFTESAAKDPELPATPNPAPFTTMLSNYAIAECIQPLRQPMSKDSLPAGQSMLKKRKIDLVDVPHKGSAHRDPSPAMGKVSKRKFRTITDLVTEQYAPEGPKAVSTETVDFFTIHTTTKPLPPNETLLPDVPNAATNKAAPVRKRAPKPGKTDDKKRKPTKSAPKSKMAADKLLSPSSAISRLNQQDVLFGTSSQLALEESPTMIRQIQQAIRDSENDITHAPKPIARVNSMPRLERVIGNRKLWTAGARDEDGLLLEEQGTVYMPEPDRAQNIPLPMDGTHESSFADIDDFLPPTCTATELASLPLNSEGRDEKPPLAGATVLGVHDFDSLPPSHQPESSSFLDIDDILPIQQSAASIDATYNSTSRVDGTSKRSLKPSSTLPGSNLDSVPFVRSSENQQSRPPVTPLKRLERYSQIEEILDSEDDEALSPTPPRRMPLQEYPPLPLVLNSVVKDAEVPLERVSRVPTSQLEWANIKPSIFRLITTHMHNISPSKNPHNPSWYEKILMYDPIVVDDLTAYLNAHTSIRVHRRATQKQIKAWNKESKKNGGEVLSVEDGGDQVLVVQKELETYMVRSWCEEYSVCCVSRDNRGRGGVRKGLY